MDSAVTEIHTQVRQALSRSIIQPGSGLCVLGSARTGSMHPLAVHDIKTMANFFVQHPNLAGSSLLFHQCFFRQEALAELGQFLQQTLPSVKLVRLSILSCPIEASGLQTILENALNSPTVETLSLINVDAKGEEAGEVVGMFLSSLTATSSNSSEIHVCNLELRSNNLGVSGSKSLSRGLMEMRSSSGFAGLKRLDLASCSLEDSGGAEILKALAGGTVTNDTKKSRGTVALQELYLDDNNLGLETLQSLTGLLLQRSNLTSLSLNDNPNIFGQALANMTTFNRGILNDWKYGLEKNKSIRRLFLERTGLSNIMNGSSSSKDLSGRPFILRLFQALERNKTLQSLNVKRNAIPNDALAELLWQTCPTFMHLQDLAVTVTMSWTHHIPKLTRAFQQNTTLTSITLDLADDTDDEEWFQDESDVYRHGTVEQEFAFHQKLQICRQRNQELWQMRNFCERELQKGNGNGAIWAFAMGRAGRKSTHDKYSSLYYCTSCFFS